MGQVISFGEILGRRVVDLDESSIGGPPWINERYVLFPRILAHFLSSHKVDSLDMDRPIRELLESTQRSNNFMDKGYGHPDLRVQIIEQSAPGYLELEAQGREVEFELDNLLEVDVC